MSVELLERAATALGEELRSEVVFVGAATLPLWISDPGAPSLRPTKDVDVVVEVSTLIAYNRFEQRLRQAGFRDEGTVLGRFIHNGDLQLDAIPAEASILGFVNHWQRASLPAAVERTLPSGVAIRVLLPANLLATKLEAFAGRGDGDYLASPDFEDIVALLDGREAIVEEVTTAPEALRQYIGEQLSQHIGNPRARSAIRAQSDFGTGGPERADAVVLPRIAQIT
jgi:hypothetical protein